MQSRKASDYIRTGALHWFLQTIGPGIAVHGEAGVHSQLEKYLANLALFDLAVTTQAAWELNGIGEELAALPPEASLSPELAGRIRRTAATIESTLWAEAGTKSVFVVTDKRFEVRKLLYQFGALLRGDTFRGLPMPAVTDLEEGGRCIAFARPTAAAFHLLRGTEEVLRHYYSCVVKRKRLKRPWGWKAMTDQMGRRRTPPPKTLLDSLDGLRENFRNPTAHPEKTYDIDELKTSLPRA